MVMIPQQTDHIGQRKQALMTAMEEAMATRVIVGQLKNFQEYSDEDLAKGVVQVISDAETGYSEEPGMTAREGTLSVIVVGHLRVAENTEPAAIEAAETALIEELKAFVRAGVAGATVLLDEARGSRQTEHPYGWIFARLRLAPSLTGTN